MERKKRSKGRGWESCYVKKIYGTFGVEMRAYGQKLVKFCTHTHTRLSYSSNDGSLPAHGPILYDVIFICVYTCTCLFYMANGLNKELLNLNLCI